MGTHPEDSAGLRRLSQPGRARDRLEARGHQQPWGLQEASPSPRGSATEGGRCFLATPPPRSLTVSVFQF